MGRLLQRRRRLLSKLPPLEDLLRGSIVERSVRCGRAGCHCEHKGGHQVAYLSVTLAAGRTEQLSLPPTMLAAALGCPLSALRITHGLVGLPAKPQSVQEHRELACHCHGRTLLQLETRLGGERIVDIPTGEDLPRIC